ncbi:hypothetical protein FQN49_007423 [Arthroderma sp. PD_2]|nr:hypothetical protein FQN49_007423 [Arthroderma sp. PD_2]
MFSTKGLDKFIHSPDLDRQLDIWRGGDLKTLTVDLRPHGHWRRHLRGNPSLRALSFVVYNELYGVNIYADTAFNLLSLRSITDLELNVQGTAIWEEDALSGAPHICSYIGRLISQLRRLRLSLPQICRDALRPGHTDSIPLEYVVIALTLPEVASKRCYTNTEQCGRPLNVHYDEFGFDVLDSHTEYTQLRRRIEKQATLLTRQMASPKLVRVSSPYLKMDPNHKGAPIMRAFDVLARKRMALKRNMAWDDDGNGIGRQHGEQASKEIHGSLDFYKHMFKKTSSMGWPEVCRTALKFLPLIETSFPNYMQEIRGIAQGADVDVKSVLALNVRTEIAYGLFDDGCTAFAWKGAGESFLAQNWDWDEEQAPNLISLHITLSDPTKPSIHMITEAGIIGKIGLNSRGVGVTLNAMKAKGVEFDRIPCHLALRLALESVSRVEAIAKLGKFGVASSCHIIVADCTGGTGLECSAIDIAWLNMGDAVESRSDVITHTNHFVHNHKEGLQSVLFMPDSLARLDRVRELLAQSGPHPESERIEEILKDEKGYPASICRKAEGEVMSTSLFSIIMNLKRLGATVKVGRPVDPQEILELKP